MRKMVGPFLLLVCLIATPAAAQTSFQFSLPGLQAPEADNVDGFRLALFHAKNASVEGFDLGIASFSEAERQSGFSMIWGLGRVTGPSSGLASGFVNVHTGIDSSVNAAFINSIRTQESGANIGFINVIEREEQHRYQRYRNFGRVECPGRFRQRHEEDQSRSDRFPEHRRQRFPAGIPVLQLPEGLAPIRKDDLPVLTGPGSELVCAAFEPLGFPGPDRGLVFGS